MSKQQGNFGNASMMSTASTKKKKKGMQGSSVSMFSSKLSGSSTKGNLPQGTASSGGKKTIRVMVDGIDLTPLSLLDEGESLAVPGKGKGSEDDKSGTNIFASSAGMPNFSSSAMNRSRVKAKDGRPVKATKDKSEPSPRQEDDFSFAYDRSSSNNAQEETEVVEKSTEKQSNNNHGNITQTVAGGKPGKETSTSISRQSTLARGGTELDDATRLGKLRRGNDEERGVDLQENIPMYIIESPTLTLFSLTGVCVGLETPEHRLVTEQNEKYTALCESREGSDIFTSRPTQTFNQDLKNVEVSTGAPPVQDSGCQASSWDIHDNRIEKVEEISHSADDILQNQPIEVGNEGTENVVEGTGTEAPASARNDVQEEEKESAPDAGAAPLNDGDTNRNGVSNSLGQTLAHIREQQVEKLVQTSMRAPDCMLPLDSTNPPSTNNETNSDLSRNAETSMEELDAIMNSESLLSVLRTVERGIQQNVYHDKHLLYRAVPVADEDYNKTKLSIHGEESREDGEGSQEAKSPSPELEDGEERNADEEQDVDGLEGQPEGQPEGQDHGDESGSLNRRMTKRSTRLLIGDQDVSIPESPELQLLWKFSCEETKNRTVSSMSWNKVNQDLLAVSYCQFQFADQKDGLILFWTLKNPEYPERIITCESGVCSIDFSSAHPSLLAAGMYDGTIAIYDLHREGPQGNKPVLETSRHVTQHKDAVWQVKWVNKNERGEVLVSLSTDGRVTEWSLKKGLASTDLMVLKRVHIPPELGGTGEGIISRTAAGLTLDFPMNDPGIYYTGTEDGTVHRCSVSYNEQYLETYFAHSGPVYKLKCSPFWPEAFLTCSADWSVRLWEPENDQPLLHFQSVDLADVVHDVSWSTSQSTVFGLVAGDGRIEIWDLSRSTLDPVITRFIDSESERKVRLRRSTSKAGVSPPIPPADSSEGPSGIFGDNFFSSVEFAYNAPIVVAGSSSGCIHVYRLRGLDATYENEEEAAHILQTVVEQNQK